MTLVAAGTVFAFQPKSFPSERGDLPAAPLGGRTLPVTARLVPQNQRAGNFMHSAADLSLDTGTMRETFVDDFSTLSLQSAGGRWRTTFDYQGIARYTLPTNGEKQLYVDPSFTGADRAPLGFNPFRLHDGVLDITASRVTPEQSRKMWGYGYASGLLTTRGTFSQLYGYFEINASLPAGQGLWSAFWLLPQDASWPPEIDVLEHLGRDPAKVYMSTVAKPDRTKPAVYTHKVVEVEGGTGKFHKYGVRWDKEHIAFYVDRVQVSQIPTPADMHKPMYLLLNLAVGGDWAGNPDPGKPFGGTYSIDYVRAWSFDGAPARLSYVESLPGAGID